MKKKIINHKNLEKKLLILKDKKKKIGLCHGVFDLIHLGHIKHFEEAKKNCQILIVSVTSDKFVFKGPGRPKFSERQRIEVISSLEVVDYVIISNSISAEENINLVKPNFYFKGPDYKNNSKDFTKKIQLENNLVKKYGGTTIYTDTQKFSSSYLLNSMENLFPKNKDILRDQIKKDFEFKDIKLEIEKLGNIKPLILGEVIIDEYIFCEALGKSGKEPTLVIRDLYKEQYLGGAGAIGNHLASFNKKIYFLTYLGEKVEYLNFIKKKLNNNIFMSYVKKKNSPTIIKKRFLDDVINSKILGLYSLNDDFLNNKEEKNIISKFEKLCKKTDLTILSDYGHGLITKKFANIIKKKSKFVAVNVQINAANHGYHSLKNYRNIDFMIINEKELRHEVRSKSEKIPKLMKFLSKNMNISYLVVTRGSSGALLYNKKNGLFYEVKAYAEKVVDKVGTGDAMLSILALCLYKKIDINLSLLIASFCAAQSLKTMGNKSSVEKSILLKDLEYYLL